MKRTHTTLSVTLGLAGIISIFAGIMLSYILPAAYSEFLNGFYIIIPIVLMLASIKTMRLKDYTKSVKYDNNEKLLHYVAAYSRFTVGLLVLAAFGVFGSAWKIHIIHSPSGIILAILLVLVSLVTLLSSILDFRARAKNSK